MTNKNKQEFIHKEEQFYDIYISHIDIANRYNVLFVEEMGKNLILFQISEEERLKHLRESLKKLFEAEETSLRLTLSELETIPIVINKKAIDVFNPITELSKFIDDTKSGDSLKMITFEPSPYGTSFKIPEQKMSVHDMVLLKINIKC